MQSSSDFARGTFLTPQSVPYGPPGAAAADRAVIWNARARHRACDDVQARLLTVAPLRSESTRPAARDYASECIPMRRQTRGLLARPETGPDRGAQTELLYLRHSGPSHRRSPHHAYRRLGERSPRLSLLPSVMILIDVARFRTPHLSSASDLLEVTVALAGVLVDLTPQPPWGPLHDSPDAPYAANEHSCISAPACSDNAWIRIQASSPGLGHFPGVEVVWSRC